MIISERETSVLASSVVWLPTTIQEALTMKKELGSKSIFVSGGTLLQIQWENGKKVPEHFISLENIGELKGIEIITGAKQTELLIGALTSLATCRKHPLIKNEETTVLSEAMTYIAAPAVRNRGTIGGNIAGRIGDIIPALIAMNADVTVHSEQSSYKQNLWDWFTTDHVDSEIIGSVHLPIQEATPYVHRFYKKVGRREAFTAAIVTVSGCMKWSESGEVYDVRIAVGGGDNVPQRLMQTECLLSGNKLSSICWKEVYTSILAEFIPAHDVFVSGEYRKKIAANLIVSQLQIH